MTNEIRTYTNLSKIKDFMGRFEYLALNGRVAEETFGFDRYLNQKFYRSPEWKSIRSKIIVRDNGNDLGVPGHEIFDHIFIHHMNPLKIDDLINSTDYLLNPEYLICVSRTTHNAIHFGDKSLLPSNELLERKPNDTCPWRRN